MWNGINIGDTCLLWCTVNVFHKIIPNLSNCPIHLFLCDRNRCSPAFHWRHFYHKCSRKHTLWDDLMLWSLDLKTVDAGKLSVAGLLSALLYIAFKYHDLSRRSCILKPYLQYFKNYINHVFLQMCRTRKILT